MHAKFVGQSSTPGPPPFHSINSSVSARTTSALMLRTSSNLFASSICRILSLGVVTSANVANIIQGDFLMQLSSAIRAALIALTVIGAGLATAYADRQHPL
jgi:hypothetical protein